MSTRWEVQDAVYATKIDAAGKAVVLALLSRSAPATAEVPVQHAPSFDELAAMTSFSRSMVSDWMKAMTGAGWIRRTSPVPNVRSGYQLSVGKAEVNLPKRESRKGKGRHGSPPGGPVIDDESLAGKLANPGKAGEVVRPADQLNAAGSPPSGPEVVRPADQTGSQVVRPADQTSPPSGPEADASPITRVLTFTNPVGVTPQTQPPTQRTAAHWNTVDRKQSPAPAVTNKGRTPRQPALFSKTAGRLPQAAQIVLDGLKADGHPNVTPEDARAVHSAVCKRYGSRVNLQWLRTMSSNRSYGPFYDEVKAARAEKVEAEIRELQRTHQDCEHGTAAGNQPHPTTGELLCPWCRTGTRRPVEHRERTHPAIAAAVTVYRQNTDRRIPVAEMLALTQQATALHRRGFTAEQLADCARQAAETGSGLLEAATVK